MGARRAGGASRKVEYHQRHSSANPAGGPLGKQLKSLQVTDALASTINPSGTRVRSRGPAVGFPMALERRLGFAGF
jgi:hypothetical protein